tara:strand:- start:661 stop:870 length:210 start_codon:yes stop_codon:yes gene_type:complete
MYIFLTDHAKDRMRIRGYTLAHIKYVLKYPTFVHKSIDNTIIAIGTVENRKIRIVFTKIDKYISVITII